MTREVNRRDFMAASATAGVGLALVGAVQAAPKPALLGGTPVRTEGFQSWPVPTEEDEQAVLEVVRDARWYRGQSVQQFEDSLRRAERGQVLRGHVQRDHGVVLVARGPGCGTRR